MSFSIFLISLLELELKLGVFSFSLSEWLFEFFWSFIIDEKLPSFSWSFSIISESFCWFSFKIFAVILLSAFILTSVLSPFSSTSIFNLPKFFGSKERFIRYWPFFIFCLTTLTNFSPHELSRRSKVSWLSVLKLCWLSLVSFSFVEFIFLSIVIFSELLIIDSSFTIVPDNFLSFKKTCFEISSVFLIFEYVTFNFTCSVLSFFFLIFFREKSIFFGLISSVIFVFRLLLENVFWFITSLFFFPEIKLSLSSKS